MATSFQEQVADDVEAIREIFDERVTQDRAVPFMKLMKQALELKEKALPSKRSIELDNGQVIHTFFFPTAIQRDSRETEPEVRGELSVILEDPKTGRFFPQERIQEEGITDFGKAEMSFSDFNSLTADKITPVADNLSQFVKPSAYSPAPEFINELAGEEGFSPPFPEDKGEIAATVRFDEYLSKSNPNFDHAARVNIKSINFNWLGEHGKNIERHHETLAIEEGFSLYGDTLETLVDNLNRKISSVIENPDDYLISERMFIAGGNSDSGQLYRKQFLDTSLNMMLGDKLPSWQRTRHLHRLDEQDLTRNLLVSAHPWGGVRDSENVIAAIDRGESFIPPLLSNFHLPNMSKSEFKRGMALYGESAIMKDSNHRNGIIRDQIMRPQHYFAQAKLPADWDIKFSYSHASRSADKFMSMTSELGHTFTKAGIALDRAKGNGDKALMAEIKGKLKRFNGVQPAEALANLNTKYKGEDTLRDQSRILANFLDSVLYRAMLDAPFVSENAVSYEYGNLRINNDVLFESISDHAKANHIPYDPAASSRNPEQLGRSYLYEALRWKTDALLPERLETNNELHKHQPSLITDTNAHIKENIPFVKLLDGPELLVDNTGKTYTIHQISDRLGLLEEGSAMRHCVFSHLQDCLDTNAVVFSIRDANNNRVATMELHPEYGEEFNLSEIQGYNNVNVSPAVLQMANRWIDSLNQREELLEPYFDHDHDTGIEDKMRRRPLSEGALLTSFPYTGPGAVVSYFAFEEYANGLTIDDYANDHPEFAYLLEHSGFKNTLDIYRDVATQLDVKPLALARLHALSPDVPTTRIDLMQLGQHNVTLGNDIRMKRDELLQSGLTSAQQRHEMETWLTDELGLSFSGDTGWIMEGDPDWFTISRTIGLQNMLRPSDNKPGNREDQLSPVASPSIKR